MRRRRSDLFQYTWKTDVKPLNNYAGSTWQLTIEEEGFGEFIDQRSGGITLSLIQEMDGGDLFREGQRQQCMGLNSQ